MHHFRIGINAYISPAVASVGINVDSYPFFEHDYARTALGDSIDKASLKLLKVSH